MKMPKTVKVTLNVAEPEDIGYSIETDHRGIQRVVPGMNIVMRFKGKTKTSTHKLLASIEVRNIANNRDATVVFVTQPKNGEPIMFTSRFGVPTSQLYEPQTNPTYYQSNGYPISYHVAMSVQDGKITDEQYHWLIFHESADYGKPNCVVARLNQWQIKCHLKNGTIIESRI